MAAPKRDKLTREQDLNVLTKLYFKHVPQTEIAKQLGISQGQVSQDLKKLIIRWEEVNLHQIDRYKAQQLERINVMEEEMWDAWELSKSVAKRIHTRSRAGKMKKDSVTGAVDHDENDGFWRTGLQEEETRGGDMQYFNGIQWCCQERSKILGLYAPKKIASTDPSGDKEAGRSAREELMGMISSIADKLGPALAKNVTPNPITGAIIDVEDFSADADNSTTLPEVHMPELAKLLKGENKRRALKSYVPENLVPVKEAALITTKGTSQEQINDSSAQLAIAKEINQIVSATETKNR